MANFKGDAEAFAQAAGVPEQAAAVEGWLRRMAANGGIQAEFNGSVWVYSVR